MIINKKYNCILYLDEAHAMGIYGRNGFGISSDRQNFNEIVVGTFSKGLGSFGSFVSCSKDFHKIIVNTCGGLIYSTVLPPSILGSIFAALKKIPNASKLRKKLKDNSDFLLKNLKRLDYNTSQSNSHIIPLILESHFKCKKLHKYLFECGFYVKEVRPPTVPVGQNRIRLSLTATMNRNTIDNFINQLSNFE